MGKRYLRAVVLGVACFALGAAFQRFYDARRAAAAEATRTSKTQPEIVSNKPPVSPPIQFEHEPLWAYGFNTRPAPGDKAQPQAPPDRTLRAREHSVEQTRPRHVNGSRATYSLVDVRDGQNVIDWFPGDHPAMPDVVAHGPSRLGEATRGCGSCHLANGRGRPENAQPAGLPSTYIIRQIQDFRSGLRHTADPRKPNTNTMIDLAKAMTDDELRAAAEYFSAIRYAPWIRVVETELVPKTKISGNLFLPIEQARTEPIAGRIIEVPESVEQAESLRNPHSGFVAYVPVDAIKKGQDLVTTGGMRVVGNEIVQGKTTPCVTCHGLDLGGVADVPPIAGRSPSYIVRQVWDIQQGTRNGAAVQLMKMAVAKLNEEDLVDIAAYVSSRVPPRPHPPEQRNAGLLP